MSVDIFDAVWTSDGMKWPRVNCYGFVRHLLSEMHGIDMPALIADASEIRANTAIAADLALPMLADPAVASVVCCWQGRIMSHVGVVLSDGASGIVIADIDGARGVCLSRLSEFVKRFTRVTFHDPN